MESNDFTLKKIELDSETLPRINLRDPGSNQFTASKMLHATTRSLDRIQNETDRTNFRGNVKKRF